MGKILTLVLFLLFSVNVQAQNGGSWVAPDKANAISSPIKKSDEVLKEGKKLYLLYCALCHGNTGKGDGLGGVALQPKPANFTEPAFKKQSDGAIYWKINTGKPPMAAYKGILKDEEIWKMIHYIKTL